MSPRAPTKPDTAVAVRQETAVEPPKDRRAYRRAAYAGRLDHFRARARAHYAKNREGMLAEGARRRADPTYREAMRIYLLGYRRDHPDRVKNLYLQRIHGLSLAEYELLSEKQGGVCAICARAEMKVHRSGVRCELSVDHDHRCCPGRTSCGQCVRGLLCSECNFALGKFGDSPARLRLAITYLSAHQGVQP